MRALLISTYDLGRQPFGWPQPRRRSSRRAWTVRCADVSRDRLVQDDVAAATLIGFFLPMHTATRLAVPVIRRVRGDQSVGQPLRVRTLLAAQRKRC